jgi:hypothetical protein
MLKTTGILSLLSATATLGLVALPADAEFGRSSANNRRVVQPISQEAIINGNDNRVDQTIKVIYINQGRRTNGTPSSAAAGSSRRFTQQGIVRTPTQLPNYSSNNQRIIQQNTQRSNRY